MPRFVVLTHDYPSLHWDFMLEKEAVLRTWRLDRPPTEAGPIAAEAIADHRLAYLDYEGPVSGNRGTVCAIDRGEYTLLADDGCVVELELRGALLGGRASLKRPAAGDEWEFWFTPTASPPAGRDRPPPIPKGGETKDGCAASKLRPGKQKHP